MQQAHLEPSKAGQATDGRRLIRVAVICFAMVAFVQLGWSQDRSGKTQTAKPDAKVALLFERYCYDCHGRGADEGGLALDQVFGSSDRTATHPKWLAVWKNLRAQTMPPTEEAQPTEAERQGLMQWIEREQFRLDPARPDPGRVTIRRLNRDEYHYTVLDLFGVDFDADDAFPVDDTGYGFDTIGDVLSLSPLHLEKYLQAAEQIVDAAVTENSPRIPVQTINPIDFRSEDRRQSAKSLPFAEAAELNRTHEVKRAGPYRLRIDIEISGSNEATSNTADLVLKLEGKEVKRRDLGWDFTKKVSLESDLKLKSGKNRLTLELVPKQPPGESEKQLTAAVKKIELTGPMDGSFLEYPPGYRRVFVDGPPPKDPAARQAYADKILRHFAWRAFRGPVDRGTIDRLVKMAIDVEKSPNGSFEKGIGYALTAILASPKFIFRAETQPEPDNAGRVVPLDEYALASRLSYFLWSSLPDDELFRKARDGKLRANLRSEVARMLDDPKSERFVENFVGQWLQTRDLETINIDARKVLQVPREEAARLFSRNLRRAMREETEHMFAHLLREDASALELLTADYTFANETLAKWYGIEGVKGSELRKVKLDEKTHRRGVLTHGSFLLVTSNPTRTSPVKRGLFILENFLGTPAAPPPANIPPLEDAGKGEKRKLGVRELLELHRKDALCASCHARMDPLGLALEEFNAVGKWRATEEGKPIETSGKLITGESFTDVRDLSRVIATHRRRDFYRCLVEKLMTFALGRGIEYYDAPAVEKIVDQVEKDGGKMRSIIYGIVESVPFQMRRGDGELAGK